MKTLFTIAFCVSFFLLQAQDTIPNHGFEKWEWVSTWYEEPVHWSTNNTQVFTPVTKDTAAFSGNYAIRIASGGSAYAKFPIDTVPMFLYARIKTAVNGADTFRVNAKFYADTLVIAKSSWKTTTFYATYNQFIFNISNLFNFPVDSASIELSGSNPSGGNISYMWVDNLRFDFVSGIGHEGPEPSFSIHPNPTNKKLHIIFPEAAPFPANLKIINASGQVISTIEPASNDLKIDVSSLSNGIYYLAGNNDRGHPMVRSFVISR